MIESTVRQHLNEALRRHNAGQLREAETLYRQVLSYQPGHADALRLLGIVAFQTGRSEDAVELIQRATSINPDEPSYHVDLGTVLAARGRDDEAISSFRRALAIRPDDAQTHARLASTLFHKGNLDEAVPEYRRALALEPLSHETHFNLGLALHQRQQIDEAIVAYRKALSLNPKMSEAWHNLGAALRRKGLLDEAATALRHAADIRPNHGVTHAMLGHVLWELGRTDETIWAYQKAVSLGVEAADVYNNLGLALKARGDHRAALVAVRKAIELRPDVMESYNNLSTILYAVEFLDEALAAVRKALSLRDDPGAYLNLGNTLRDVGELDEAIAAYRKAADHGEVIALSSLLVTIYFHSDYDSRRILQEHQKWAKRYAQPLRSSIRPHDDDRSSGCRLRIGYFSHRLGNRPIGRLLLPLLSHHDRDKFEIFCYCDIPHTDYMTQEIRRHIDVWRDTGKLSDEAVADLVRRDRIDIFVDLTMHMGGSRLLAFARKPAPVQVTYLAYCGTTGLDTIDYRITDPYLDPPDRDDSIYTEKSIRLPRTYWCIAPPREAPDVPAYPQGRSGPITFGCFNSYFKVTPQTLKMWSALLRQVPHSRLIMHSGQGSHRQKAKDIFAGEGVDPDRVSFVGSVTLEEYYRQYEQIDIALDPHPYPGGTTSLDALWMGVPVVTLAGESAHSRGGLSILSNIGLTDLVGRSPDDYIRIASTLATDLPRLSELRATLRQRLRDSALMDGAAFARDVEAAFRKMWKAWCNARPEALSTEPSPASS